MADRRRRTGSIDGDVGSCESDSFTQSPCQIRCIAGKSASVGCSRRLYDLAMNELERLSEGVGLQMSDGVASIVLDRPDKRNAVDLTSLRAIERAQTLAAESNCTVLVVRGTSPAFCSGADLDGAELGEFTDVLARVLSGMGDFPGLAVAYVDGPALGAGLQLAAACDVRIATVRSTFGVPAAKLGLAVDAWTVRRMTQELGWSVARAMLLTGDAMPAADLTPGFVHRLVSEADVESALGEAMTSIIDWSRRAPLTIVAHKRGLERIASDADVDDAEVESARLAAWASSDAVEGRAAFRERRPPRFRGH